jgi:DNA-binding transcriptional ArsR family regulator
MGGFFADWFQCSASPSLADTVSRHLKVLRDRSLVKTERNGAYIHYELADPRVLEALDTMRTILADTLAQQSSLVEVITP